ncbi:unnamed protein product [Mesocestoides corti]|uniref:Uncharacterized protein n=1 Tax=Mesocestoides corti TaxID=53468 RepID=A0A0R3UIC9_MESCO|nr:unnamed protein product [Mesocestoides corti]
MLKPSLKRSWTDESHYFQSPPLSPQIEKLSLIQGCSEISHNFRERTAFERPPTTTNNQMSW